MGSTNNSDGYFGGGKFFIANGTMGDVDANTAAVFVINGSGQVGIGTASPSRNLTVSSSGQTDLAIIAGTSASAQLQFGDSGDDNIGQIEYNNSDNSMAFYANASEAMMIHSAGNVSIGNTAADNGILSITAEKNSAGSLWSQVGPNNNASLIIQNSSSTDNTNACLYFANDAGVSAAINARFVDHSDDETELRLFVDDSNRESGPSKLWKPRISGSELQRHDI